MSKPTCILNAATILFAVLSNTQGENTPVQPKADPWVLTSESADTDLRYAPTLANGFIGAVIPPLGTAFGKNTNHIMDGFYRGETQGAHKEGLALIPQWNCITFNNGANDCLPGIGTLSGYAQQLNMKEGTVETRYTWTDSGKSADIRTRTFVSRNDPHLAVVSYSVTPRFSGPVVFKIEIDSQSQRDLLKSKGGEGNLSWITGATGGATNLDVAIALRTKFEGVAPKIFIPEKPFEQSQFASFVAVEGKTYTVTAFVGIYKGGDPQELEQVGDILKAAQHKALDGAATGGQQLFARHKEAWADLWKTDIVLEGSASNLQQDQQVIRNCLFTLTQYFRPGGIFAPNPMGYSAAGWSGSVFWDSDFFQFPILQLLHPDLAMPILRYRHNRLGAARQYATDQGFKGAQYPHESRYSGTQQAPSPFNHEIIPNAYVIWAFWHRYQLTGDKAWLKQFAWPVIKEVADFIVSRVVEKNGRYELHGVITPDENAGIVNNSVHTNAAFKRALDTALAAASIAGETPNPLWKKVASQFFLPFNQDEQVYWEYDAYKGQSTKQADVEMLIYPIELPMSDQIKRNILNYYGARVCGLKGSKEPGPNMTYAFYVIGNSELGERGKAYDNFKSSLDLYIRPPFDVSPETTTNNYTDFMTGKAAILLAVINGFAGVRVHDDGVHFRPCLPPGWRRLTFTHLPIGGAVYDVAVDDKGAVSAKLISGKADIGVYNTQTDRISR